MKQLIRPNLFSLILLMSISLLLPAVGGGSIAWEDVRNQIRKDDPIMAKFIESQFAVDKVGSGLVIGKHIELDPEWKLFRLPPFEFIAKAKGAKDPQPFLLTLTDNEDGSWTVSVRAKDKKK